MRISNWNQECHQCGDFYCDTCYWKAHSTGALVQHTFDALIPYANPAKNKTEQTRRDCGGEQMCKVCYNTWWYPQGYDCFTLSLETSMRRYRDKVLQKQPPEIGGAEKREEREERWRVIEAVKKIKDFIE